MSNELRAARDAVASELLSGAVKLVGINSDQMVRVPGNSLVEAVGTGAGGGRFRPNWAALSTVIGEAGDNAIVPDTDTGTHTDPITEATVPNAGVYLYVTGTPSGWQRIGATQASIITAAVDRVDEIAAGLVGFEDVLTALDGMIADGEGTPIGLYPLAGSGDEWGWNSMAYVGTARADSTLSQFAIDIRFAGDGTHKLLVVSGEIDFDDPPDNIDFTIVTPRDLPNITSTGPKLYGPGDFGELTILKGQHLIWVSPLGGAAGRTVSTGTGRFYFRSSVIDSGTGTFSSVPNTKLNAWATMLEPQLEVPRSALADKALLDDLEALADPETGPLAAIEGMKFVQQTIGFPGDMTGGALASVGTFGLTTPFEKSGDGIVFAMDSNGSGTVYAQILSVAGSTITVVREQAVSVVAGDNEFTLPDLPHEAGQFFGFRGAAALFKVDAAAADYEHWTTGSQISQGSSYTSARQKDVVFLVRCDSIKNYARATNLAQIDELARKIDNPDYGTFAIGRPMGSVLADGVTAGSSYYVFEKAAPIDMVLHRLRIRGEVKGEIEIASWEGDASSMTQLRKRFVTIQEGDNEIFERLLLFKGERFSVRALTGNFSIASMPSDPTPYYPLSSPSGTPGALNTSIRFEVVAEFVPLTALERIDRLEAKVYPNTTKALHIHWLIGESHVAGRAQNFASSIPTGRGYSFRRATNTLAHLADPTGNDGIATTAPVRGSFGPEIGQDLLDRTGGAVGALIINSGEGGTTVGADWGSSGAAWTQAKADWDAAIALAAGLPIAGVTIVGLIGSNDADAGTAKSAFKAGYIDLIERAQAYVDAGPNVPFAMVMTGPFADGSNSAAVADVQAAQAEIVREVPNVFMASTALRFADDEAWFMDEVHFSQPANKAVSSGIVTVSLARGTGLYPG